MNENFYDQVVYDLQHNFVIRSVSYFTFWVEIYEYFSVKVRRQCYKILNFYFIFQYKDVDNEIG